MMSKLEAYSRAIEQGQVVDVAQRYQTRDILHEYEHPGHGKGHCFAFLLGPPDRTVGRFRGQYKLFADYDMRSITRRCFAGNVGQLLKI
jgi:hypothetical protein